MTPSGSSTSCWRADRPPSRGYGQTPVRTRPRAARSVDARAARLNARENRTASGPAGACGSGAGVRDARASPAPRGGRSRGAAMRRCLPAERAPHRQEHVPRRPLPVHVNPGGQLPRQRGYSPPHASNGVVVVVVCTGVVVVVDLEVVLVAGRVVVVGVVDVGVVVVVVRVVAVVVVVEVVVVVVVEVDVVVGGVVVLVVVVDPAVDWKVASTMTQLEAEPKVRFPSCGPAALDRMSSRSEEALPFCASMRYGTFWLLPAAAEPGWPPVRMAATTSSPAGTEAVGPAVG